MAASASGVRAGKAYVEIGSQDSALRKGLDSAKQKIESFGKSIQSIGAKVSALGAGLTAPFLGAAKLFSDVGDKFAKTAARTGVSVESISQLAFASEQSGASLEALETGLRKMQKTLGDAATGSQSAQESFAMLGLSSQKLLALSPEDQFKAIADRIAEIKDPTLAAAAAMEIFGKSGTSLVPLMAGGAAGIEALQKEADSLGLTLSGDDAKSAEALNDAMNAMTKAMRATTMAIGASVAPLITAFANGMAKIVKLATDWVNANRPLLMTIFQVGAALVAAGTALAALGTAVLAVSTAFSGIGVLIGILLNPITLVIGGLAALGTWFVTSTTAGGQALTWLGERFSDLLGDARMAFGGIGDALASGDIALAGKVLWAALKLEWLKGTAFLSKVWADWGAATVTGFRSVSFDIAGVMTDAWAWIQSVWIKGIGAILDALQPVLDVIQQAASAVGLGTVIPERMSPQDQAKALAQIEQNRTQSRSALVDQQAFDATQRQQAADLGVESAMTELSKAQQEFANLRKEAAKGRDEAAGPGGAPPPSPKLGEFTPATLDAGLTAARTKTETKGTFSAATIRGLATGDTMGEIADASKKTADNTASLVRQGREDALEFGA